MKFISPPLKSKQISVIRTHQDSLNRLIVKGDTGQQLSEFTTTTLQGSHDHRISARLGQINGSERLIVEGSVHKCILGHNLYGGPLCPYQAGHWFIDFVGKHFTVELPEADLWFVYRIDIAEVFDLGSKDAVSLYLSGLNNVSFPRRNVARYGNESINAPGASTSLKLYAKGTEFRKHDFKRLRSYLAVNEESISCVTDKKQKKRQDKQKVYEREG